MEWALAVRPHMEQLFRTRPILLRIRGLIVNCQSGKWAGQSVTLLPCFNVQVITPNYKSGYTTQTTGAYGSQSMVGIGAESGGKFSGLITDRLPTSPLGSLFSGLGGRSCGSNGDCVWYYGYGMTGGGKEVVSVVDLPVDSATAANCW